MRAWYLGKVTDPRAPNKLAELDLESLKGRVYIGSLSYSTFCLNYHYENYSAIYETKNPSQALESSVSNLMPTGLVQKLVID